MLLGGTLDSLWRLYYEQRAVSNLGFALSLLRLRYLCAELSRGSNNTTVSCTCTLLLNCPTKGSCGARQDIKNVSLLQPCTCLLEALERSCCLLSYLVQAVFPESRCRRERKSRRSNFTSHRPNTITEQDPLHTSAFC